MVNIYINSDTDVELRGLRSNRSNKYITDAVVTFSVLDSEGAIVNGLEDIPMIHTPSSPGSYFGTIPSNLPFDESVEYTISIQINAEDGSDRNILVPAKAIMDVMEKSCH